MYPKLPSRAARSHKAPSQEGGARKAGTSKKQDTIGKKKCQEQNNSFRVDFHYNVKLFVTGIIELNKGNI